MTTSPEPWSVRGKDLIDANGETIAVFVNATDAVFVQERLKYIKDIRKETYDLANKISTLMED